MKLLKDKKQWTRIVYYVIGFVALDIAIKSFKGNGQATAPTATTGGGFLSTLQSLFMTKSEFIGRMTPIATQIKDIYGIDPLVTMTQAALESGWGSSGLTAKANNLYGFTGDSWAKEGKSVIYLATHEWSASSPDQIQYFTTPGDIISKTANPSGGTDLMVNRPFRAYPTWYDSVADWANLIAHSGRYAAAYEDAKAGDANAFANDVAAAGYATEPDYASQLVAVADEISGMGIA